MSKSNWKDTLELIGIAAIVASLVFVGLELQHGQRIAQADQQHQQIEREFLLTNLIADHANLIARMNNGEDLDEEELILADLVFSAVARPELLPIPRLLLVVSNCWTVELPEVKGQAYL